MFRFRRAIAFAMCAWLLLSGGAAMVLVSLEAEHDREHALALYESHDGDQHTHGSAGVDLLSHLSDQAGFAQLTSGFLPSHCAVSIPQAYGTPALSPVPIVLSFAPMAPPGPPPRSGSLLRGAVPA